MIRDALSIPLADGHCQGNQVLDAAGQRTLYESVLIEAEVHEQPLHVGPERVRHLVPQTIIF
jgi:hypothetical protein